MSFLSFAKNNKRVIVFYIFIVGMVNFILITSVDLSRALWDILYLDGLIGVFTVFYSVASYFRWQSRYGLLKETLDSGEKIDATLPEDGSFYSALINEVVENKNSEWDSCTRELRKSADELNDYITKWVHEIKIPVSVCELVLERSEDYALVNDLQTELEKIKFLTNQVLYISRASSYHEDLSVRSINLDRLVKSAIKRNASLLISKNIEISLGELDYEIISDEKWISYVMDQILNNAYKYTDKNGKISVSAAFDDKRNVRLSIRDNGVGIPKKDISRVFDRTFTGNNKSYVSKSTGMGLYISKKMLDRLGHKIEVESQEGMFTEFTITFFRISDYILKA